MMYNNKQVHIAFTPKCMLFIQGERLQPNRVLKIIDNFGRPLIAVLNRQGDGGEDGEWDDRLVKPPESGCYFYPLFRHKRFDPNNCSVFSELVYGGLKTSQVENPPYFIDITDSDPLPMGDVFAEPGQRKDYRNP
jgi:hypothetical protein